MRVSLLKLFFTFILINIYLSAFSQDNFRKLNSISTVLDSLKKSGFILRHQQQRPEISISASQALRYLEQKIDPRYWQNASDPLRQAFNRLIFEAANPPLDSLRNVLIRYPYDSLSVPWDKFYVWAPLKVKIPVLSINGFQADSIRSIVNKDTTGGNLPLQPDSLRTGLPPHMELKDTTLMVITDSIERVSLSGSGFPFLYAEHPFEGDSIQAAVNSLLNYIDKRDSVLFSFTGIGNTVTPFVVNSESNRFVRYWLKNEFSDSVAVWIGNPSRNTIGLYLEQGINFKRPARQSNYAGPKINTQKIDTKTLQEIQNMTIITKPWKYRTEVSFVLNQAAMSNWVKGGEGSVATALDITGYADYSNKLKKISSGNFARLKFGYLATDKDGLRKNLDLLETNSKFNHLAFGKFDFSAIMLFKTQIAHGNKYLKTPDGRDSTVLVSKFLNPATLTIGLGLDYKPNKNTSINFSPLSYKGTYVTDTVNIDQTQYGIAQNKRSLNEPGASFMINHQFKPTESITIINRLQLFTNYIHNPQNIDVDWEMIATAHLNWFTDVRLNTHLIFDDDAKTSELYKNGTPVLLPDGKEKKSARIQFKEMIGFSVSFRF